MAGENPKIIITNSTKNSYLPKQLSDELESFGYDVTISKTDVKNSANKPYDKTFIYDYSNNSKKYTIDFLEKYLGNVPTITLDEKNKGFDLEIIIGSDFKIKN
jgi:hypothetical protein